MMGLSLSQSPAAHNASPFPHHPKPHEQHLFAVFQDKALPCLIDYFDRDFWEVSILHGIRTYPAAWYAALAIGAVYQQLQLRHSDSDGGYQCTGNKTIHQLRYENAALIYCNKVARLMIEADHVHMSAPEREMLLLACILLTCYANFRGDSSQSILHTSNGVYLSKQWKYRRDEWNGDSAYRLPNCVIPVAAINRLFRRLELQLPAALNNEPDSVEQTLGLPRTAISGNDDNSTYYSAMEAYGELQPFLIAQRDLYNQSTPEGDRSLRMLNSGAAALQEPFLLWQKRFRAYKNTFSQQQQQQNLGYSSYKKETDRNESDLVDMVEVFALGCEALFFANISKGELAWDDYNDHFCHMIDLQEYILRESPLGKTPTSSSKGLPSLSSFVSLVISSLVILCMNCRIPTIRRRGLQLIAANPFDGGIGSKSILLILQARMAMEENGWQRSPIEGGCNCVADAFICGGHRIPDVILGQGGGVTFRSCYEAERGLPGFSVAGPVLPKK